MQKYRTIKSELTLLAKKYKSLLFLLAIIVWSFLPFLRVLIIGARPSQSVPDFLISNSFDLIIALLFIVSYNDMLTCIKQNIKVFITWLILVSIGSIVAVLNNDHLPSLIYGLRITYVPVLIYFVFKSESNEIKKDILKWLNFYIVIYTFLSVVFHCFFYNTEKRLITELRYEMSEYFIPRTGGFLLTPVPFAIMICFSIIYYLDEIIKKSKTSLYYWLFLGILYLGLAFSVTRAGLGGITLIYLYFLIRTKSLKKIFASIILFVSIVFAVFQDWRPIVWILSSSAETIGMQKGVTRVMLWKLSFNSLKERPILGYGIGGAGASARKYFNDKPNTVAYYTTDGWFLKTLNEVGVVGFTLFFVMIYFMLQKTSFISSEYLYETATLLFIVISSIFNNLPDFYPLNIIIYFLLSNFKSHAA